MSRISLLSSKEEKRFYLVWNSKRGNPKVRHETYEEAFNEAKRVSELNPGDEIHVLCPVVKVISTPINEFNLKVGTYS